MNIRIGWLLAWVVVAAVMVMLLVYLIESVVLGIILGIPFLLFVPGFILIAAVSPDRGGPGGAERIILSFALSLLADGAIGLILHYTSFGITMGSVLAAMAIYIFVIAVIAMIRLGILASEERAVITLNFKFGGRGTGGLDGLLTVIVTVAVIGTVAMAIFYGVSPARQDTFTRFYIVDENVYYPEELNSGETGTVLLAIGNHEDQPMTYRIVISVDGEIENEIGPLNIADGEEWRGEAPFTPVTPGTDRKVEFHLYRGTDTETDYSSLYIWVDVLEPTGVFVP